VTTYYNEIDPYAAQWLRNLIDAGHIAPGVVDERSIEDVRPDDLREFTQCHFFAGIGIWSLALRRAGWSDDRPVWTGSCPCQPFSESGQGAGFADERHLWPAFFRLIGECRPAIILGEQVAGKRAGPWIDLVQDDLEGLGYAVGAAVLPAGGFGSDHIRDRTYWCAHADQHRGGREAPAANHAWTQAKRSADRPGRHCGLSHRPRAAAEWLLCADGKSRPAEPGVPVLVDEYPGRVDQLRAFGNAIDAQVAQAFIEAVMAS
jgi:DNA (cytosine-5)-methyltransferase 1